MPKKRTRYKFKKTVTIDEALVEKSRESKEFDHHIGEYIMSLVRSCPNLDQMKIEIVKATQEEIQIQAEKSKLIDAEIKAGREKFKQDLLDGKGQQ